LRRRRRRRRLLRRRRRRRRRTFNVGRVIVPNDPPCQEQEFDGTAVVAVAATELRHHERPLRGSAHAHQRERLLWVAGVQGNGGDARHVMRRIQEWMDEWMLTRQTGVSNAVDDV